MSYQLISETTPKAQKGYRCIWCGQHIPKGEQHVHEVSRFDGRLQDHRWHRECWAASRDYFKDGLEFWPYENERGG